MIPSFRRCFSFASKKLFVGGNWKSNNTVQQTKQLVEGVLNKLKFDKSKIEVIVSPPALHIPWCSRLSPTRTCKFLLKMLRCTVTVPTPARSGMYK
jgi:hypothetical protein